jgi:hypothetical protein
VWWVDMTWAEFAWAVVLAVAVVLGAAYAARLVG